METALRKLRGFMFERVYENKAAKSQENKAEMLMVSLYEYYLKHLDKLPGYLKLRMKRYGDAPEIAVCDYIGAMSDRFAIAQYEELFIPKSWHY